MIIAAGIDLGGTKSEVQLFDEHWQLVERRRDATPDEYEALVAVVARQIGWADACADVSVPVGIGAAGMIDPEGNAFTANLPATGRPFPSDIANAAGKPVTYVNDCRATALSEAVFGAGRGRKRVMSLILGTGVGGGVAIDGELATGPTRLAGEFGHISAAAHVVAKHQLPIHRCGCGRMGCVETYISGNGLARMSSDLIGRKLTPDQIGAEKQTSDDAHYVWNVWKELTAELMVALVQTVDPDVVVLGGGLSRISGIAEQLEEATSRALIGGFAAPKIVVAQGGDASGARGAALAAWQEANDV